MFTVDSIYDEAKKIIGACSDEKLFAWSGDVVAMIANKTDTEAFKGYLDICTTGCGCTGDTPCSSGCGRVCITLPREVETVIAVNIGGTPAMGFGQLFSFHLNGPGDFKRSCDWSWYDQGANFPVQRDLITPAQLVAYLQSEEDNGKKLVVYGYDTNGNKLRRQVNGSWLDGYQVPTIYGYAIPEADAPTIARITAVYKEPTVGQIRLATTDAGGGTGVVLGIYEPDETVPQYRRIKLNRACNWVRVAYLKTNPVFQSRWDHIPLNSRLSFLMGMQARRFYAEQEIEKAHAYEADAARLEVEAQMKKEAPLMFPLQVDDRNNLRDKSDYWIN